MTKTYPDLGIGGPSVLWLNEALIEMRRLAAMKSPDLPAITFLGTDEKIVDPGRIHKRMKRWPKGKLTVLNGAKHEPMMDNTGISIAMFDEMCKFFDQHI
jgi:lysophospholipase